MNAAKFQGVGGEPRLYNQRAAGFQMPRHVSDGLAQATRSLHVSDRAEETNYNIEFASEIKGAHVAEVELDLRMTCARDLQHLRREIDALNREMFLQKNEM